MPVLANVLLGVRQGQLSITDTFAGFSTGANVAAALKLLKGEHRGQTIVTMACDSSLKYLSTELREL